MGTKKEKELCLLSLVEKEDKQPQLMPAAMQQGTISSTHDDLQKKEQKPVLTDHAHSGTLNEITESG